MALRFNMKSIMLLFLLATGPFWLEYLLHQKIRLFWGSESFKMFHGLRLQPILAVNVCRCAIWRWFPFTSPCLSMGECEAMPAASSVTPFFLSPALIASEAYLKTDLDSHPRSKLIHQTTHYHILGCLGLAILTVDCSMIFTHQTLDQYQLQILHILVTGIEMFRGLRYL